MTDYSAVLNELMVAGYEGAGLLAAFERLCAAIGGAAPVEAVVAAPMAQTVVPVRRKAAPLDRRQLSMMLPSDGGQAKTAPMSDAERQARRRERLRAVTLRDINAPQVIENIEESRNVTKIRDSEAKDGNSGVLARDAVTRGDKKRSPHTPLRKTKPPYPPKPDVVTVPWDSPLMAVLEELAGKRFKRFGQGRSVARPGYEAACRVMSERAQKPPLKATG